MLQRRNTLQGRRGSAIAHSALIRSNVNMRGSFRGANGGDAQASSIEKYLELATAKPELAEMLSGKATAESFVAHVQEKLREAQQSLESVHSNLVKVVTYQLEQWELENQTLRAQAAVGSGHIVPMGRTSSMGRGSNVSSPPGSNMTTPKSAIASPKLLEVADDGLNSRNKEGKESSCQEIETITVPLPSEETPIMVFANEDLGVDIPGCVDRSAAAPPAFSGWSCKDDADNDSKASSETDSSECHEDPPDSPNKHVEPAKQNPLAFDEVVPTEPATKPSAKGAKEKSTPDQLPPANKKQVKAVKLRGPGRETLATEVIDNSRGPSKEQQEPPAPKKTVKKEKSKEACAFQDSAEVVEVTQCIQEEEEDMDDIQQFELLDLWLLDPLAGLGLGVSNRTGYVAAAALENKALIKQATQSCAVEKKPGGLGATGRCVISPSSPARAFWDILSLFFVLYDITSIPLILLDPPENDVSNGLEWITRLWWTGDIPLSFMTGYLMADGTVVMDPMSIAKKYITRWFPLDACIVTVDWIEVMGTTGGAQSAARMGKASKTFRILRMVRLLRLARMQEVLKFVRSRCRSEMIIVVIDIMKVMGSILAAAHFIACGWYGVGRLEKDTHSWIYEGKYSRETLAYRYLLSFHWSISQFNGGMDLIYPVGQWERLYAVIMTLFCWVMAAAFVSALTSEMTRLHILASQQAKQASTLQRYLKQCRISDELALRVQRNAQHAINEMQRMMPESEVELLGLVSEPLRIELHFEMYSPVLECHPFFHEYSNESPQVVRKVCHEAMLTLLIASGDVIFNAGEIPSAPKMYVVCTGFLDYIPLAGQVVDVQAEHWLSEAVLWTVWMHRGVLKASGEGRLCVLDAIKFQDIAASFDHDGILDPRHYAYAFLHHLNQMIDNGELDKITDMPLGKEETFTKVHRESFSFKPTRLSSNESRHSRPSNNFNKLKQRRRSAFMDPTNVQTVRRESLLG